MDGHRAYLVSRLGKAAIPLTFTGDPKVRVIPGRVSTARLCPGPGWPYFPVTLGCYPRRDHLCPDRMASTAPIRCDSALVSG